MSLLEAEVVNIRELFEETPSRQISYDANQVVSSLRNAGLILREESTVELGCPQERPSARVLLYSNVPSGDLIHVVGEDTVVLQGRSVSFAQVVVITGKDLDAEGYYQFTLRHQRLLDQPGCMVKAMESNLWVRLATVDGEVPNLQRIGSTMIGRIHQAFPKVEGVEVYFIVNRDGLVMTLSGFARKVYEAANGIKEGVWKERGFDWKSCQLAGHCGNCSDKKTCVSVRKIEQKVRLKRRNQR